MTDANIDWQPMSTYAMGTKVIFLLHSGKYDTKYVFGAIDNYDGDDGDDDNWDFPIVDGCGVCTGFDINDPIGWTDKVAPAV